MLWHEQSWQELDQIDRDTPVVIPLGACEQHGHHLPLFVDTIQVTALAERVEREMGDKILLRSGWAVHTTTGIILAP